MANAPWFKEAPLWAITGDDDDGGRMVQLHQEIVEFYEQERAKQEDEEKRTQALERVVRAIRSLWPNCEVKVFGSFATGLYLPRTSDIDIVILGSGNASIQSRLQALRSALQSCGVAKNVEVIGKARVPIVKFEERESSLAFDARFDSRQELLAAEMITSALALTPPLAPLYLVLKTFLQLKHLNEVYHTGGLASYTLFVMLNTFLQVHPNGREASAASAHSGLGFLLAGFFHFYGTSLNVREYGISCRGGDNFFLKAQRGFYNGWKPYLLAVEDPLMPSNDVGKNSFNFPKIQTAFRESYELLTLGHFNQRSVSLLSLIFPGWPARNRYI